MDRWYRGPMLLNECYFETDQLVVGKWSGPMTGDTAAESRHAFVVSLLTEAVTHDLPPSWQGTYDVDRASQWFSERQSESTVLFATKRSNGHPVGLLILSESAHGDRSRQIRLGYMIHEDAWGQGLATEIVAGLVEWCGTDGSIQSVIGGVARNNAASSRVLQKNGFIPRFVDSDQPSDEVEYIRAFTA